MGSITSRFLRACTAQPTSRASRCVVVGSTSTMNARRGASSSALGVINE